MRLFAALPAFFALLTIPCHAQDVLFSEDFNGCSLPSGWLVKSTGNQNPVWYVGDAVQNNDNNGQSMNGSCFLFMDDDATGDQTPAYILDFISPAFDASHYSRIELSVDVHYRDWNQADEYFEVLVTDGITETLIRHYDNFHATGNNLYEFETLAFDLSLVTKSPNAQLIFRYNDAGGFNWWAGIDNISVIGKGQGTNVVVESGIAYDLCTNAFPLFTGHFCLQILDGSQPAPYVAIGLQVEEKCMSTNISELKIEAKGGISPYTFSGTPNGQTLASGETYLVVVTDALGCEKALTGTADDCEAFVCNIGGTTTWFNPNCFNGNNGSVSVMVAGGTAPYHYIWSNGATAQQISNLPSGTYSVTVTDALDCTFNADKCEKCLGTRVEYLA